MTTISSEKSKDRRVKRTKLLLRNALFSLLKEKNYSDITVKELCELADVNRGTFYLHYKDVYDMIEQLETEVICSFEELFAQYNTPTINGNPEPLMRGIFCYAAAGTVGLLENWILNDQSESVDEMIDLTCSILISGIQAQNWELPSS